MDDLFPTLFSKTFFIVSVQLFITWATTQIIFSCLKRRDPDLDKDGEQPRMAALAELIKHNPDLLFFLSPGFFQGLIIADFAVFLTLLFWGIDQSLEISMVLFSIWSVLTGIQMEYALLAVDHGVGRKVLALTASIVLATSVIGIDSHVDFHALQLPLFIGLTGLIIFNLWSLFRTMSNVSQKLSAAFGVALFTLYLVFDFNSLAQKQAAGGNGWNAAMRCAINLYLDIINLILQLLKLLGSSHH